MSRAHARSEGRAEGQGRCQAEGRDRGPDGGLGGGRALAAQVPGLNGAGSGFFGNSVI